jgi:Carboxypeptidase regulatory-like domain
VILPLLLSALLLDEVPAPPPVRGRLCIGDRKTVLTEGTCADVQGKTPEVAAADRERLFVWTSDDAKTARVGIVPAKAAKIEIENEDQRELTMFITGEPRRGWPLDTTVMIVAAEQWQWKIPADAVKRLQRVFAPRTIRGVQAEAEHHQILRRRLVAPADDKPLAVGELRLEPIPAARGTVVDAEGNAVANALVSFEQGKECTNANEQGAFTCELTEEVRRKEVLVVSAPGLAAREVRLPSPPPGPDMDLGRITLHAGHKLTLKFTHPDPKKSARVQLFLNVPDRYEHSSLGSKEITEAAREVTFEGVAKGTYLVLVEGSEPLERLEVPVEIKEDGNVEETIEIEPFRLEGTVRFGDEPLTNSQIELLSPEHTWRTELALAGGTFGGTMWQHGTGKAFVHPPGVASVTLVSSPHPLGDDPSRWDIKLEKRLITGRVLDAETKTPVRNVEINVMRTTEGSRGYFSAKVNDDGTYQILANEAGTYQLRVSSREHAPVNVEVKMAQEDRTRNLDIPLERGSVQPLQIVGPDGERLGPVTVLEGVLDDRVNPRFMWQADASGRFDVRGKPGETRVLYVVPRTGSIAVVRMQLPRAGSAEPKPLQVVVPRPNSSLRVKTRNKDDKPVGAIIVVRYNGEFIPPAILRFVTGTQMSTGPAGEAVFARLPAGAYELWAAAGPRDEEALLAGGGAVRAPVRVGLSGGEQSVTVPAPDPEPRERIAPRN